MLAELGAELAVVTLGEDGAVIRGAVEAEAPGTAGRGGLDPRAPATPSWAPWSPGSPHRGWDAARADEALGPALDAAAAACTRWGALE